MKMKTQLEVKWVTFLSPSLHVDEYSLHAAPHSQPETLLLHAKPMGSLTV